MSLTIICPAQATDKLLEWSELASHPVMSVAQNCKPLAPLTMQFIQAFSNHLLRNPAARAFPELVALGDWLRQRNIKPFVQPLADKLYKSLGLVVHYAPNNVDTQFVYSWLCALLMGNRSIVRLGSQNSPLQQHLISLLNDVMVQPEFAPIARQNLFCRYDREASVGQHISEAADARMMWGGDDSVNAIRQLPTKPRCRDISFADRYSACIINGDALCEDDIVKVANELRRDTEAFLQQACSSPRVVFWLGNVQQQDALWSCLGGLQAAASPNQRNEQLVFSQYLQASGKAIAARQYDTLSVITLGECCGSLAETIAWHPGYQSLLLLNIKHLSELALQLDAKCQTLSYWGVDKSALIKFLASPSITGVDRVVPVGQALNFSPEWDGYELLNQLSRKVTVL